MCIAVPCKILKFIDEENKIALGDFMGIKREINVQLIEDAKVNDYVIVHVGYAIQKIDVEDALERIKAFNSLYELQEELGLTETMIEFNPEQRE